MQRLMVKRRKENPALTRHLMTEDFGDVVLQSLPAAKQVNGNESMNLL